ncbi:MAG: glycosyl hydrolase, partial [Chloroflexi bacterium]|nr:glycosyl hydrolase [Chloroflexota bacterium]
LGFEGEGDFHLMGVGYQNHAIYVLNSKPNSKLSQAGLYYSLDDGQTWQHSAMTGLTADPIQIAVHPTQANIVVMATQIGLYLSNDYGAAFEPIAESGPASAAVFISGGDALIFGYQGLFAYDLVNKQVLELSAPALAPGDAIGYIAVSPVRIEDIAVATFQKDLFLSKDGAYSWQQIAQAGVGMTLN